MISETSPEIERIVLELRRRQSPGERLVATFELMNFVRTLELGVLRTNNPDASEEDLLFRLAEKRYGQELARRVFNRRVMAA
jgi:hypothetical protein